MTYLHSSNTLLPELAGRTNAANSSRMWEVLQLSQEPSVKQLVFVSKEKEKLNNVKQQIRQWLHADECYVVVNYCNPHRLSSNFRNLAGSTYPRFWRRKLAGGSWKLGRVQTSESLVIDIEGRKWIAQAAEPWLIKFITMLPLINKLGSLGKSLDAGQDYFRPAAWSWRRNRSVYRGGALWCNFLDLVSRKEGCSPHEELKLVPVDLTRAFWSSSIVCTE